MEGELIEYVRAYPMLYDFKNKYYRNQVVRKEAWDEIGEKLDKSGDQCKDAWNKLRNAYTNTLNRRKTKSGQVTKKMLNKFYTCYRTHVNSSEILQDETQEEESIVDGPEAVGAMEDETQPFQYQNVNESLFTDKSDFISLEPPSNDSKRKRTSIEATMYELVLIMKSNSRMRSQQLSQNQSATSQSCLHDK
ncbi:uncharacterized protein LOC111027144 [Myzus persicae]|uniref:uncharacterized protein LOC111027144 n=1 Tax=Myzus persicae TaxID=13164 RepID=UPI000B9392D8|nr:uncharacterized protein LOC111027144 [Myzus persicae]